MRPTTVLLLVLAFPLAAGGAAQAQDVVVKMAHRVGQAPDQAPQADIRKVLEERIKVELKAATSGMLGEVVTGAPYSALTTTESVQTLADGNRIVQRSAYNVARDGQGRVRREELNEAGAVTSVMIMDPVANTSYVLDPAARTARKAPLLTDKVTVSAVRTASGGTVVVGGVDAGTKHVQPLPPTFELKQKMPAPEVGVYAFGDATFVTMQHAKMEYRNEPLGTQVIEGVAADGTRSVGTIPAGQIGNERPIEIVSEQWYSKELKMTVMNRRFDPRTGETIYRVSNIRRAEPDASLFQVPSDYTVK